jgi:hypothetical protein
MYRAGTRMLIVSMREGQNLGPDTLECGTVCQGDTSSYIRRAVVTALKDKYDWKDMKKDTIKIKDWKVLLDASQFVISRILIRNWAAFLTGFIWFRRPFHASRIFHSSSSLITLVFVIRNNFSYATPLNKTQKTCRYQMIRGLRRVCMLTVCCCLFNKLSL